jgi:protein-S-isoprenylcysteine O-methyltransferase Ste14
MLSKPDNQKAIQRASPRQWIGVGVVYFSIPLVLLVCGGDFGWWQAWVYSLLIVAAGIGGRIWAERRHPGYAGNIPPLLGIVLALGSLWALVPAAVALIIAVIRTALEDQSLQEELPGYRDYARRVLYRLIPGIY